MTRAREISNVLGRNIESTTFTATAGQTAFSITHAAGRIQVYMNGLLLDPTVDWTSDGSTVTLTEGAVAGDELEVVKFDTLSVADVVPATGGTFTGNVGINKGTRTLDIKLADTPVSGEYGVQFTAGSGDYLGFGAGGSGTAIAIDSSNRVTTPSRPAFDVALDGSNYTTANPVIFDEVYHNVGSHYSTTTGRFTCPVAGMYLFYTSHIKNGTTAVSRRRFNKNGSAAKNSRHQRLTETTNATYGDNGTFFITIECAAGDYITVEQYAGSVYGSREYDYFGGYLIG